MAFVNPNKPAGLTPVKYLNGAMWNGQATMYAIAAADANAYWNGDLVKLAAGGDPATGVKYITLGTAGAAAVGVLIAVGPGTNSVGGSGQGGGAGGPIINVNNLAQVSRPAAAQPGVWYALVVDDPNVIFEIQEGGAGANLTAATGTGNANILYAAPAAGVYQSGTTLDNGSVAGAAATANLKIYCFKQQIDNHFVTIPANGGGAQKWWVLINNHQYKGGTGTAGV